MVLMTGSDSKRFTALPRWAGIACLAALLMIAWEGGAQALDTRPLCEVCRRYTDTAPCRIQAVIEIGKHKKGLDVCSVFCLCERLEDYEQEPLYSIVRDYATYGGDDQRMLRAEHATYLYDASGDEQQSHEPYTYAFGSEEEAGAHQSELGGEIMDWSSVFESCTELAGEWEPEDHDSYSPLRKGQR
jgi:hypothetical protein